MRVNTLAIQHGESVVIRLLRSTVTASGLGSLGLTPTEIKRLNRMIHAPNGIVLVTGPTGSGKTSTLYSCLKEINTRERKIITIEDPIEYPLTGINQTQISQKAGLSFPVSLRAIMRHDPDVIMIGEIRDKETLQTAIQAASTGHLVFSTIHTNSTAKTIARLKEMGAPSYLISATLVGIVAQRLARRICEHCKTAYQATPEELKILGFQHTGQPMRLYKGAGCKQCNHSGYKGRIGLYEIMTISEEIQELIDTDASVLHIQNAAIKAEMSTLSMDGERKVSEGLTTVEEISRILGVGW
jgi:type IV pilus assembly protein PilB